MPAAHQRRAFVFAHGRFIGAGKPPVRGDEREIRFPHAFGGRWREAYDSVILNPGKSIRFTRKLKKGESVFCGDLRTLRGGPCPYRFEVLNRRSGALVEVSSPTPFDRANFWANHRVACFEPFVDFAIAPGETFSQEIRYKVTL